MEDDADYDEVRVLALGGVGGGGVALVPIAAAGEKVSGRAFLMRVGDGQVDSLRAVLARGVGGRAVGGRAERPAAHDVVKSLVVACGGVVTKVAVTHVVRDVFVARVWVRGREGEESVDARPSDALAIALRFGVPVYLNRGLLERWNVRVEDLRREAEKGLCQIIEYGDACKSTRSIVKEVASRPEHIVLAKMKMELDLAVRLERFAEAAEIRDAIAALCPVDRLEAALKVALCEERYLDAASLQDQITVWRARILMWEKGGAVTPDFDGGDGGDGGAAGASNAKSSNFG